MTYSNQLIIRAWSSENLSWGFPTRSHTNRAVQPQKMARGLKFWIYGVKTKAQVKYAVTVQLISAFVFAYAKKQVFSLYSQYAFEAKNYLSKYVRNSLNIYSISTQN